MIATPQSGSPLADWERELLPPVTWSGVAQMECAALRELTLTTDDITPRELFCYRCGGIEPVARLAMWSSGVEDYVDPRWFAQDFITLYEQVKDADRDIPEEWGKSAHNARVWLESAGLERPRRLEGASGKPWPLFCRGPRWFRIKGYGVRYVDHRRNPPFFSERNGYRRGLHIGPHCLMVVKP